MKTLSVTHFASNQQIIYNSDYKSYKLSIISGLEDRFLHMIYENLKNIGLGNYLVISCPEFVETQSPIMEGIETTLQAKFEITSERPYYVTVLKYKNQEVKPIEDLRFWERVRFLFTGKYPV